MSFSYYTKEGLKNLRDELNQLKDVERPLASKAIAEARDKGDFRTTGSQVYSPPTTASVNLSCCGKLPTSFGSKTALA